MQQLALGGVADTRKLGAAAGRHHAAHRHLVARERAGLVGADHRGRAQGLHRRELAHDHVAPGHALHAQREHNRGDRGEPLGHGGHGQAHAQQQHIHQRPQVAHAAHHYDSDAHHHGDDDHHDAEQPPHAPELALQRGRLLLGILKRVGDLADLSAGAGGRHHGAATARGHGGAAKKHIAAVAQRRLVVERRAVLAHAGALAGEGRLGHAHGDRLEHAGIGGQRVALLDQQQVARHQLGGHDLLLSPVAQHTGVGRGEGAQRGNRLLGAILLHKAEHAVEQHDREDGERLERHALIALDQPGDERDRGGDEQQAGERVAELGEEAQPGGGRRNLGQLVAPVAGQALGDSGGGKPASGVELQVGQQLGDGMPVGSVEIDEGALGHWVSSSTHGPGKHRSSSMLPCYGKSVAASGIALAEDRGTTREP